MVDNPFAVSGIGHPDQMMIRHPLYDFFLRMCTTFPCLPVGPRDPASGPDDITPAARPGGLQSVRGGERSESECGRRGWSTRAGTPYCTHRPDDDGDGARVVVANASTAESGRVPQAAGGARPKGGRVGPPGTGN